MAYNRALDGLEIHVFEGAPALGNPSRRSRRSCRPLHAQRGGSGGCRDVTQSAAQSSCGRRQSARVAVSRRWYPCSTHALSTTVAGKLLPATSGYDHRRQRSRCPQAGSQRAGTSQRAHDLPGPCAAGGSVIEQRCDVGIRTGRADAVDRRSPPSWPRRRRRRSRSTDSSGPHPPMVLEPADDLATTPGRQPTRRGSP